MLELRLQIIFFGVAVIKTLKDSESKLLFEVVEEIPSDGQVIDMTIITIEKHKRVMYV